MVLHDARVEFLAPLFGEEPFEVICIDGEKLCINFSVMWRTVFNWIFKTRSVFTAYSLAAIETIRPALVVTWVDNSGTFQNVAKIYRGARFLAIQNSSRYLWPKHSLEYGPIFLTEFACFGQNEIDMYSKVGADVGCFYPVGSLTDSYHRALRAKRTPGTGKKNYDLCLVSEFQLNLYECLPEFLHGIRKLVSYLAMFCERNEKTIGVAGRADQNNYEIDYSAEIEWYKKYLGNAVNFLPYRSGEFTTYQLIDSCSVSLAVVSSTLTTGFGRGNRILYCNFTGNDHYDFPVKGMWSLNDASYEIFEARLLELLEITDQEFMKRYGHVAKYLVDYDTNMPTHVFLKNLIAEALN